VEVPALPAELPAAAAARLALPVVLLQLLLLPVVLLQLLLLPVVLLQLLLLRAERQAERQSGCVRHWPDS
jgi:hypothetical protein